MNPSERQRAANALRALEGLARILSERMTEDPSIIATWDEDLRALKMAVSRIDWITSGGKDPVK